jgi:hypothetical protein
MLAKSVTLLTSARETFKPVPFRFGKRLYARAPEPKRFIGYVGGGHNDLPEKHDSYRDLKRFVLECFDMSMGASTAIRASPAARAPPAAQQRPTPQSV